MADSASGASALLPELLGVAREGVRVTVESNIAPAFGVFGGGGGGRPGVIAGLGKLLGVRAGLVVRSSSGDVLWRVGDPAEFSPARSLLIAGGFVAGVYLLALALRRK